MPLSLEEASKRCESYSQNIQDSILIMESFMGSDNLFTFDLPQVITNLESIDTHIEEKNAAARIKVLEEYQRMLVTESQRRSVKQVVQGKMEFANLKSNLKRRRQSLRIAQIFKPNVLPAMATAGQVPQPTTSRMPPLFQQEPNVMPAMATAGQVPQPTTSRMPPLLEQEPNVLPAMATADQVPQPTTSRMPPLLEQEPIVQDELMLEF